MSAQSLTSQESQARYGTTSYTGWGQTGADADFNAKGGKAGSSSSSGSNTVQGILDSATNAITSMVSNITPYDQANPFSFDEALATQAATAEYTPYYDQMLSDYTQNVETTKSRSQEDLQNTLTQLAAGKEYYTGTERRLLDRTLDATNNGYAGQGLFFSGAKQKDIDQINTEYNAQTGEYNRQYDYNVAQANLAANRTSQDVATGEQQYGRDIAQEKQTGIAQGVLQRQSEAIQQYDLGEQQYYTAAQYGGGQSAANATIPVTNQAISSSTTG
jgi:hypothetical protein